MTTNFAVNSGDSMQNCFDNNNMFAFGDFNTGSILCGSPEGDIGENCNGVGYGVNDQQPKRGANMTECVHVPSSEHVAEIVGRQGCKIKALRSKTNTYIKTPSRGEQSVFVVTGRQEDVSAAKREIMSAADHFSQIRASRRSQNTPSSTAPSSSMTSSVTSLSTSTSADAASVGQSQSSSGCAGTERSLPVTVGVRVPDNVVGLVVGPKGATIKRIQQDTDTYIVTPGRNKDPVFEVIGSKENVEAARREIESYIETRMGAGSGISPGTTTRVTPERTYGQHDLKITDYSASLENKDNSNFKIFDSSPVYEIGVYSSQDSTFEEEARQSAHIKSVSRVTSCYSTYSNKPVSSRNGTETTSDGGFLDHVTWANSPNNLIPNYPYSFLETDRFADAMTTTNGNNFSSNRWEQFFENSTNTQDAYSLTSLLEISLQNSGISERNGWTSGDDDYDARFNNQCCPDVISDVELHPWVVNTNAKQSSHFERGWPVGGTENGLWNDLSSESAEFGNAAFATRVKAFLAPVHLQQTGVDRMSGLTDFDGRSLSYTPSSSPTESSVSTGSAG